MRQKDWIWKYYWADGSKYRHNRTHENAWCLTELQPKINSLRDTDKAACYAGARNSIRNDETLTQEAIKTLDPICGKVDIMINHLLECESFSSEERIKVREHQKHRKDHKKALEEMKEIDRGKLTVAARLDNPGLPRRQCDKLSPHEQSEFAHDMCDVFVACGIAWNELSNPIFQRFFGKWIPEATVPNRQSMSGQVLPGRVAQVEKHEKQVTRGELAMGQCDGWKNIARTPVVAMLMTVQNRTYVLKVHNVGASKKTAENLLMLIKLNMEYARSEYGVEWIGWCSDAGGDSRKARTLLFDEIPRLVCPDCVAHVINLLVGDYFKIKADFISASSKAQEIIRWFNNHSRALEWLHEAQKHTLGKILSLIYPVITRWTSIYMALDRLLRCLSAFQALLITHNRLEFQTVAGTDKRAREKALEVYDTLMNPQFWGNIDRIARHLQPLLIAAHITEGKTTRLDQVMLTLGSLYHIYSRMTGVDEVIGTALCASVMRHWATFDQDIYILAVFLNPYLRSDLFNKSLESGDFLCAGFTTLIIRVWKRLFGRSEDPDSGFLKACMDYYCRSPNSIFSDAAMNLAVQERSAHADGHEVDICNIWKQLDDQTFRGRNWLVKLAVRVLSVVANSAGCERLFSQMARVHTNYRSRLNLDCVRNTVVLKQSLLQEFEDETVEQRTLKRKHRDFDPEQAVDEAQVTAESEQMEEALDKLHEELACTEANNEGELSIDAAMHTDAEGLILQLVQRYINDVNQDAAAEAEMASEVASTHHRGQTSAGSFGRPAHVPLSALFDYLASVRPAAENPGNSTDTAGETPRICRKAIDMYWTGGQKNLETATEKLAAFQAQYRSAEGIQV